MAQTSLEGGTGVSVDLENMGVGKGIWEKKGGIHTLVFHALTS